MLVWIIAVCMYSANVEVYVGLNLAVCICSDNMVASAGLDPCCLHVFSQNGGKYWFESLLFTYVKAICSNCWSVSLLFTCVQPA